MRFLSFDGISGIGKTTIIQRVTDYAAKRKLAVRQMHFYSDLPLFGYEIPSAIAGLEETLLRGSYQRGLEARYFTNSVAQLARCS